MPPVWQAPFPVSSLTLEYVFLHPVITAYFLQDTQSVLIWNSYPTDSPSLHLVCRGIHRQQHDSQRTRLPITINILQLLKEQLRICTHNTPMEKRLLWAAFTLAFYRFFRASELLSNLTWSHITLFSNRISITLYQSKLIHSFVVKLCISLQMDHLLTLLGQWYATVTSWIKEMPMAQYLMLVDLILLHRKNRMICCAICFSKGELAKVTIR